MRYVFLPRLSLLLVALLVGAACDNGDIPTDPSDPPTQTTTFTGAIQRNGSQLHTFTAPSAGRVTATITSVSPAGSPAFGFSMGTWNPTSQVCTVTHVNNAATTSSVLTGTIVSTSSLCIRLFDSNATIPANSPVEYTVTVQTPVAND